MASLLVNSPTGEQIIQIIDDSGAYFDPSRVLWDTRTRGEMPPVTLGKMQLIDNELVTLDDFLPAHSAAIYAKSVPQEVPMTAACEALINAGLYDAIDTYIQTLTAVDRVWWQRSDVINRAFQLVAQVQTQLGLTDQQMDQLFISAEQIRKQRAGGLSTTAQTQTSGL